MRFSAFHPFTQFVPLPFFRDDGDVPFRDAIHHKYSIKIPKQRVILLRIEWKTGWWRFRFDTNKGFWHMILESWKMPNSRKFYLWSGITGSNFDLEFKKNITNIEYSLRAIQWWLWYWDFRAHRLICHMAPNNNPIESNPLALFLSSTMFGLKTPSGGDPPVPSRMVKLQVPARVKLSHRKWFVGRHWKKFRSKWSYAIIIAYCIASIANWDKFSALREVLSSGVWGVAMGTK